MNFTFYNELISQPDVQDLTPNLHKSFSVLDSLHKKINTLPAKDINTASFAEVSAKVENLINKHFPNLVHDYCKLSLEYRNTVVIKKEQSNGQVKQYTAKDILLNNLGKLIEEIYVLENEFNENYTHKLLVQKRLVDQLGIQKDIVNVRASVHTEVELEKPSIVENFNYQVASKSVVEEMSQTVINKHNTDSDDSSSSTFSMSIIEILMIVMMLSVFIGMGLAMYNKDKGQRNISKDIINMIILNDSISSLYEIESKTNGYKTLNMEVLKNSLIIPQEKIVNNKYINSFDGEIVVKPYTQKQSNDSFLIETSNIPKEACMKMSMSFPSYIPVLIVNDHVVKENLESQIDRSSLLTACDHDSNKIGIINKY